MNLDVFGPSKVVKNDQNYVYFDTTVHIGLLTTFKLAQISLTEMPLTRGVIQNHSKRPQKCPKSDEI